MSLGDREHVEAVAIIRQFVETSEALNLHDADAVKAGRQWLAENHPTPAVYVAAIKDGWGQ
jgi:hypothetical protein